MNFNKFIKGEKGKDIEAGSVLIAKPYWQDDKYRRSVIMILCHDEIGTTGIILNKETSATINIFNQYIYKSIPLHYGGPFDRQNISFVHTNPAVPDAINMGNELYWGGDVENFKEFIFDEPLDWSKIKFFSGFVEWGIGQLAEEINENKWWTSELTAEDVFSRSSEELWTQMLSAIIRVPDEVMGPSLN